MAQLDEIVSKSNIQGILDADAAIVKLDEDYAALHKTVKDAAPVISMQIDSFAKLRMAQEETLKSTKKLNDLEKQTTKQEEAMAKAAEKNAKAMDDSRRAIEMEAKTIAELRLQNKELIKLRDSVNVKTREGRKAVSDLNKQIDENNKRIKENSSHLEKQKINVGNYISSWGPFQGIANMVTQGIGIMRIAFISLKAAIISTGIGALVVLLGSLYTYFTRTGEGADRLAKFMAQVRAVVDVLIDRFALFGEGIALIFSGKFKEGAEKISQTFKGIGKEMSDEIKLAGQLAEEADKLEEANRANQVTLAKNNLEKEKALEIARSENSTLAEKEAAIKRAMALARENNAIITQAADQELKNLQETAKMRTLNDEELQKLADLEVAALEKKAAAQGEINSLLKLQNKILGEVADQERVAADKKLEIGEMEVIQFGQFEQAKTELHAQNMELRTQGEEQFHKDQQRRIEEEKEARLRAAAEYIAQYQALGQTLLDFNQFLIDSETQKMEQAKAYELQLAGDNAEKRTEIEKKYDKEASKLKAKQAKQDKAQALFSAIIKTAQAVLAGLAYGPPLGYIFAALNAVLGAVQIGVIASQPIPQFFKGTKSAPDGLISVAERGEELIQTRSGHTLLATRPTIMSGMKGARIYTNKETEAILAARNVGYDSPELRRVLSENNDKLIRTIRDKKEVIISTPRNARITEREGMYFKTYYSKKIGG